MKKKKRVSLVGVAFVALLLLVIAFLVRLTLHRPPAVELPQLEEAESSGDVISDASQESIRRVEVTPETVQRVIERLTRPDSYSRTITIERFWSDGGGQSTAQVRAADAWVRIDTSEPRHVVTGDGRSWIWYDADGPVYTGAAALSADEEQSIPTYEDILLADVGDIAVADYRTLNSVNCIYVETAPDPSGYADRWWVSVENGLLVAAERVNGETVVYRMTGLEIEEDAVTSEAFQLPDGTILHEPQSGEAKETEG